MLRRKSHPQFLERSPHLMILSQPQPSRFSPDPYWGSCHTWPWQVEGPGGEPQPESTKRTNLRASTPMVRGHADKWKSKEYSDIAEQIKKRDIMLMWLVDHQEICRRKKGQKRGSFKGSTYSIILWTLFYALSCHANLFKPHINTMKKLSSERLSCHPLV